jgi:protein-disulfide isomerase
MPLLGLGFYLAALVLLQLAPTRRVGPASVDIVTVIWALAGVGVMAFLTYVELFDIRAACTWCLVSALASVLLATGAILVRHRGSAPEPAQPRSARARRLHAAELERSHGELRRFTLAGAALAGAALVALLAIPAVVAGTPAEQADLASVDRPRLGDGAVEVVVYSDFQCPACAAAAPALKELADTGEISLIYRYFPLTAIHPNATEAAHAAQAAELQGRFWDFHDALFARQSTWASMSASDAGAAFEGIARDVGMDIDRWRSDAASPSVRAVVAEDARDAERLSLSGTPTIFVDGQRYGGPLDAASLLAAVRAAAAS